LPKDFNQNHCGNNQQQQGAEHDGFSEQKKITEGAGNAEIGTIHHCSGDKAEHEID